MKIIEGMKQIKDLTRKAEDLRKKVQKHHATTTLDNPEYGDAQQTRINGWIQAHSDILKEIRQLRYRIQMTNCSVDVSIELGGKTVTMSIAEWIHRRRDLAAMEKSMWDQLTDRNLQDGAFKNQAGDLVEVKVVRHYNPDQRDEMRELFASEPMAIDARLEVVNAVTDLVKT